MDWREAALETDSFADVGGGGGGEEAFDFDRLEGGEAGLAEHLLSQLHGGRRHDRPAGRGDRP